MTDTEIWADIEGYEKKYQVSNLGRVKSLDKYHLTRIRGSLTMRHQKEKILKQWKRSSYNLVDLWNKGKRDIRSVHNLVYETFHKTKTNGYYIHHVDENKQNNRLENLRMLTRKEHNGLHHGGRPSWNKGLKMPPETLKKAWETRKRKMKMIKDKTKGEKMSDIRLADEERQPCECWTRQCHGLLPAILEF